MSHTLSGLRPADVHRSLFFSTARSCQRDGILAVTIVNRMVLKTPEYTTEVSCIKLRPALRNICWT